MYRCGAARVWACLHLLAASALSEETNSIVDLENVAGKLLFYQNEGNTTFVRDTGELASDVQTVAMFEISDPQQSLRTTKLTYTWDFGNGEVIEGTEPVVRYNYMESGNYTLRLRVGSNVTKKAVAIAGVYSMDVKVLDVIKNIHLEGPSNFQVSQNITLLFHVDGSPPMWVCWRILPDCKSTTPVGCTLTMMYSNLLRLNYAFPATGVYCLDISARNDISKLQTSYSLHVGRSIYGNLFFILSCVAVLLATFSFIAVAACRPRHHNALKIAASSNTISLNNRDGGSDIKPDLSAAEKGESQPLIQHQGTQYS